MASKDTSKQWDSPQSQQSKAEKGVHGQSHGQDQNQQQQQQQQSTSGPAQHTQSKATGMAPASATLTAGARGYKTTSKAVVTETEPDAPAASTQKDGDYVYICVGGKRWPQRIPGEPIRCSTMFLSALGRKILHQSFNQFQCSYRRPRRGDVF